MLRVRDAAQTFICTDPSQYSAFVLSFDTEAEHINGEKRFLAGCMRRNAALTTMLRGCLSPPCRSIFHA